MAILFVFSVKVLVFVIWLIVSRFCLWGWYLVWSLSPSNPDPVFGFLYVSLFFFFCLVGFVDAVFSLFFCDALFLLQNVVGWGSLAVS